MLGISTCFLSSRLRQVKSIDIMSARKKKVRNRSGFLTGLMIVSTGLIAGYHGFELAVSGETANGVRSGDAVRPQGERSRTAVNRQVNALDQLITASLEKKSAAENRTDRAGLEKLILAARSPSALAAPATEPVYDTTSPYPVVNRALKQDRGAPARQESNREAREKGHNRAVSAFIEAQIANSSPKSPALASPLASPSRPLVKKIAPVAAPDRDIPFADGADVALFAADMPLPAKLTRTVTRGTNGLPLLARSHRRPSTGSPLVPRKYSSTGKAFGGLAERAFQKRERRCMTTALYFEARGEPAAGQIAVGQVVMNRVKSPDYPDTICGVVYQGSHRRTGCQFSFTCDGKADKPSNKAQWERSKRLANQVLEGKVWLNSIGDATHYHATYVSPRWRRKMARLKQIGRHIFYKSPNISVTDTYQRYTSGQRS